MGLVFTTLAAFSDRLRSMPRRLVAGGCGAAGIVGLVALTFPACLHDPMAGVDPLLRSAWLSDVGEALPLWRLIQLSPGAGLALLFTLASGLIATLIATIRVAKIERDRWFALLLLGIVGFVGTLWQVRVAASACAFLIPGVTWFVLGSFDVLSRRPKNPALFLATLIGVFGNGAGWTALAARFEPAAESRTAKPPGVVAEGTPKSCFDPASYAALGAVPPGLVLSTIDPGSAILAYTKHSVLAAPYHRNIYGNRVSLLALAAPPDAARSLIWESHARYLALCRFSNETAETAHRHPDSLSASLLAGNTPAWLTPVGTGRETILLFRVEDGPTPAPGVQPVRPAP
jgi:hypothetical protein